MNLRNMIPVIVCSLLLLPVAGQDRRDSRSNLQENTYSGVTEIELRTVSGNCQVRRSNNASVMLAVEYSFDERSYEADIEQRGNLLIMKERFHGRNNSGSSNWRLAVPDDIRISFSTASGDFTISDLRAEIDVRTASGDIRLTDVEGEVEASTASGDVIGRGISGRFRLSSASGDVELEDGAGDFKASSASGDVFAQNLSFTAESSFSSASGNAKLRLSSSPEFDLKVSSASGDATLALNGVQLRGYLEVVARKDRNIRAPFSFDREETISRWNQEYVRKSIEMGSDGPLIEVSTASGRAEIQQ